MPKKTKKEKIIAEYRKKLQLLKSNQMQNPIVTPITSSKPSISIPMKEQPKKQPIVDTQEDSLITSYFKKDFKKSLFLIAIVITLEFSLYFATINNYLKLIH